MIIRMHVVFPAPFGPMNPYTPPRGTVRSMSRTATVDPNVLLMPRRLSASFTCSPFLEDAWLRPPNRQDVSLRIWIALAMLVFLIAEALFTRTGWKLPLPSLPKFTAREKVVKAKKVKVAKAVEPVFAKAEEKPVVTAEAKPEESERRSRYQRAKDRK